MFRRTFSHLAPTAMSFFAIAFLLAGCATAPSGKHGIDFSHYDEPLNDQVTDHIKAKVMARLGEGKNTRDRYFIIPFAYENKGNDPEFSHSFISVIRVLADDKQPKLTPELRTRSYKGRNFEAFTISWLPRDFPENPHLCVFEGFGAALVPSWNTCPISRGKSFDLPTTLKLAVGAKVAVGMWGPYEITQGGFELGVKRLRLLESGELKYRADDRGHRENKVAINCFHAMAGLDELFPKGGFLDTGFKMWGLNGTKQVLREYTTKANRRGLLLEPVDIDKDIIGFVYAPARSTDGVYNPFKSSAQSAFAYRK
jgi:hypothetical protein